MYTRYLVLVVIGVVVLVLCPFLVLFWLTSQGDRVRVVLIHDFAQQKAEIVSLPICEHAQWILDDSVGSFDDDLCRADCIKRRCSCLDRSC